jgi:hypothetical protein
LHIPNKTKVMFEIDSVSTNLTLLTIPKCDSIDPIF